MSSNSFNVKVVTPAGPAFEDEVIAVTLPASDGEIGILPGHAAYTGLLGTGIMTYTKPGQAEKSGRLVISEGFCNFTGNELVILADWVAFPEEADKSSAALRKTEVEKDLAATDPGDSSWKEKNTELRRLQAIEAL